MSMSRKLYLFVIVFVVGILLPGVSWAMTLPFINEIHYDNIGGDINEGIEIAGSAGINLSGWSLVLYNGSDTLVYNALPLYGYITNQQNNYGTLWFPVPGLQNGSPDALALVDSYNSLIQFISYEGFFVGGNGPAVGILSTDIGVDEDNPVPPLGYSLQLIGTGNAYSDFAWSGPILNTRGAVNTGQIFIGTANIPEPATLSIFGLGLLGLVFRIRKFSS